MYRSSIYRVWWNMVQRCTNSKHSSYRYYGGRGITICARWMEPNGAGFRNFVADMGAHPGKGYSIDRINNDGHYEPGNCRWVTRSQQASNTRSTSLVTIRGRTMPVEAWCKVYGILPQTVWTRVARGIPVEKAITTPAKRRLALTVDGERKPVARWAREHGLDPRTVANRIRKGWKLSDAATTPVRDARSQRFTHRGKTLRLKEWSRALGIGYTTLRWRVAQGWPIEKVLTP